jgi:uncharacterized protein (DUF2236 family)
LQDGGQVALGSQGVGVVVAEQPPGSGQGVFLQLAGLAQLAQPNPVDIVLRPDVSLQWKPLVELVNQVTIGLLPAGVRRLYGFRWDPLRALTLRSSAEVIRRLPV